MDLAININTRRLMGILKFDEPQVRIKDLTLFGYNPYSNRSGFSIIHPTIKVCFKVSNFLERLSK
jgi:hypothetical protein